MFFIVNFGFCKAGFRFKSITKVTYRKSLLVNYVHVTERFYSEVPRDQYLQYIKRKEFSGEVKKSVG